MSKIIRIGRKLGRVGGKLVTDAGGAPCCCEPGGPCVGACTQAGCRQCGEGDTPPFWGVSPSLGNFSQATVEAVAEEAFAGFQCATCQRSTVNVGAWSFTANNSNYSIQFSAPALTLCRTTVPNDGPSAFLDVLSQGTGAGIWWAYRNYGFGYAYHGYFSYEEQPLCAWRLTDPAITKGMFTVNAESSDDWLPFVDFDYSGEPDAVEVSAMLVRVTEDKIDDGTWRRSVVGVILVVEYRITINGGPTVAIYAAPGGAGPGYFGTDTDFSSLVNIKDWGGWISCLGVEVRSILPTGTIRTFSQTYEPCSEDGGCDQVYTPNGATVFQIDAPFDVPINFMTAQWPKGGAGNGTYTSAGFSATIEAEYGPSCDDDPLFTLV